MFSIAIDGPAGAGKSYLADKLAERYHLIHVDTGALYRTVGLYVYRKGIATTDTPAIIACLPEITLKLSFEDGVQNVILNGEIMGTKIRTPEIAAYASAVSAIPEVRTFLLETQRQLAREQGVIMDGRDIGTVILPDADVKIFLVADNRARAKRRLAEFLAKGIETTLEEVLADMEQRDQNDSTRKTAPLKPAADAIHLDNSEMTPDETVAAAIAIIEERRK